MKENDIVHYVGVVEGRNDPLQIGRVQVRVIGVHSPVKSDLPSEDLPWATVAMFNIESGVGTSEVLIEGTRVLVVFLDQDKQEPVILGVLPGVNTEAANPNIGFNDPTGKYPTILESDLSRLSRTQDNPAYRRRTTTIVKTSFFDEPISPALPQYPFNRTVTTESGHAFEMDDTPTKERINLQHKSGTFVEFHPTGERVAKIVNKDYEIVLADKNLYVRGALNVVSAGDVTVISDGNLSHSVAGKYVINAGGAVEINGSQIHLNTGSATIDDVPEIDPGPAPEGEGNNVYVQPTMPTEAHENDLWINTADGNKIYAYKDGQWVDASDTRIVAESSTGNLKAVRRVIEQEAEPNWRTEGPFANGDIWVKTSTQDRFIWNAILTTWSFSNTQNLGALILQAGTSRAINDKFIAAFKSPSIPEGASESDYWLRSDVQSIYQLREGTWRNLDDQFLANKFVGLLANALYYIGIHVRDDEPGIDISRVDDIWFNPSNGQVRVYNGSWVPSMDPELPLFFQAVLNDRAIRDGRVSIFIDFGPPSTADEGDMWLDISNDPVNNLPRNHVKILISGVWERVLTPFLKTISFDLSTIRKSKTMKSQYISFPRRQTIPRLPFPVSVISGLIRAFLALSILTATLLGLILLIPMLPILLMRQLTGNRASTGYVG